MKQIYGVFDIKNNKYTDSSEGIYAFDNNEFSVWVYGSAESTNGINCGEELADIFKNNGTVFTEKVCGVYIVVILDTINKSVTVFHDRSTSSAVLYYTECDGKIYISTSLKRILSKTGMKRQFNENTVEEFITNGFIYGEETLVKNVFKLKAFHCLKISEGKVQQLRVNYPVREISKGEALDSFKPSLNKAIKKLFDGESEINLPLSSGFDSNYIAYVASEKGNAPINAFSVGGKFGKNELPVVEANVKHYNRMKLNSALTDKNTLQNLPDIVWRLEGSVYEVGLFLQYELAKLVFDSGKKYLICGECADQVMNKYYLQEDRLFPQKNNGNVTYYEFSEYPFIFGNYLILKKNGILANSFGIETRYPYLDNEVVSVSHALRSINGKDKRVHTANCEECLPDGILKNMSKIGGATECHSLFNSAEEIKEFFAFVEKSNFYISHENMIKRHSYGESQKQTGIKKYKTLVRNMFLRILHLSNEKNKYFNEEVKLREYMCIAYIVIFEKLFITDEYSNLFSEDGINLKLSDVL